jgi:hypothetical protein
MSFYPLYLYSMIRMSQENEERIEVNKSKQAKKPIVLPEFEEQSDIADLEEEDTTTVPIIFRMPKKHTRTSVKSL